MGHERQIHSTKERAVIPLPSSYIRAINGTGHSQAAGLNNPIEERKEMRESRRGGMEKSLVGERMVQDEKRRDSHRDAVACMWKFCHPSFVAKNLEKFGVDLNRLRGEEAWDRETEWKDWGS